MIGGPCWTKNVILLVLNIHHFWERKLSKFFEYIQKHMKKK
jgi:hypothetical protein